MYIKTKAIYNLLAVGHRKNNRKKTQNHRVDKTPTGIILIFLALGIYFGLGWFLITRTYSSSTANETAFTLAQNFQGSDYQNSLDLRITKKAVYTSNAIRKVSSLGQINGNSRFIVQFDVSIDKLSEYGLMSVPTSPPPAKGYPVIILCHAYRSPAKYKTEIGYLDDMDFYSQHGFVVIKPDFRGQGMSSDQGSPEGSNYSMAYNTDVMSLISAVKKTDYLNSGAINVWGHSMGAYIAFRASVLSKDIRSAVLLAGPVGDFEKMFIDYTPPSDVGNPVAAKHKAAVLLKYGTPKSNPNFWHNVSPLNYVSQSNAHYQIHVGSLDIVVPPEFSAQLNDRLDSLAKPHQYYVYTNGGHNLGAQRPLIWERSLSVLKTDQN
jgi:uncharacterized protein